jgi:hypothetical protein
LINIRLSLPIIFLIILLSQSCTKGSNISINGVKITENTVWEDIIDDSDNESQREQIRNRAEDLLLSSRFNELEEMAEKYRESRKKFKNGEWELNTFYAGLTHYLISVPAKDENWEDRLEKLREWVKSNPDSVTARIALSECLVGYAFAGRGYGYADSVTDEHWRLFHERLSEAQNVLNGTADKRDKDPQWQAASMRFTGDGWTKDKYEQIFEDAVSSNPDFAMYYFRTAVILMPRWYGRKGDFEKFIADAADRIGGKEGDILYAQIIWFLDRNFGLDNLGRMNPNLDWLRVKQGVESIS